MIRFDVHSSLGDIPENLNLQTLLFQYIFSLRVCIKTRVGLVQEVKMRVNFLTVMQSYNHVRIIWGGLIDAQRKRNHRPDQRNLSLLKLWREEDKLI